MPTASPHPFICCSGQLLHVCNMLAMVHQDWQAMKMEGNAVGTWMKVHIAPQPPSKFCGVEFDAQNIAVQLREGLQREGPS